MHIINDYGIMDMLSPKILPLIKAVFLCLIFYFTFMLIKFLNTNVYYINKTTTKTIKSHNLR